MGTELQGGLWEYSGVNWRDGGWGCKKPQSDLAGWGGTVKAKSLFLYLSLGALGNPGCSHSLLSSTDLFTGSSHNARE